jgi:hypothetical protein
MKTTIRKLLNTSASIALLTILLPCCSTMPYFFRTNYNSVNELIHAEENLQTRPFLKAHLKDGGVVILKDTWQVDSVQEFISGNGIVYDSRRTPTHTGPVNVPIDDVAIFETNKKLIYDESSRVASLSVLTGVDILMGVLCITMPKACFGSCPTFYVNPEDNFQYADAEGFSHAFYPVREYFDLDALPAAATRDRSFTLTMKNEALETHCVNDLQLYAWPVGTGEAVYQTRDNEFYLCENTWRLSESTGDEGVNTALLRDNDRIERFSLSDPDNLKSKEEIFLTFDSLTDAKAPGLVIHFRQTLMTTYFIYNCFGYMGDYVGDVYASMETGKFQMKGNRRFYEELGDIDVYLWDESEHDWVFQGGWYETGPIAMNRQMLPLKTTDIPESLKLKLVLNRGLWRIDYLALTNIRKKIEPMVSRPVEILNRGIADEKALGMITDPEKYLVSKPGDEYTIHFRLPEEGTYAMFLYSKGYYLEWMRKDWLKDQDLLKLRQMIKNPDRFFRTQAAEYKRYETDMEQIFWNSKIDPKTFVYHEN